MKLCLISPYSKTWEIPSEIQNIPEVVRYYEKVKEVSIESRTDANGISYAFVSLASVIPSDFDIEIIDEKIETIDFSKNYDIVGIGCLTNQATRAYAIADEFRKKNTTVVIGGIHATVLPEEAKQHCDSVIIGEGEYAWPQLIEDFRQKNLKPFYKSDEWVDLTKLPMPRYDLLANKGYKMVWIQTTRGCPHDCEFCVVNQVNGSKIRSKSVGQIVNEIKYIKEHLGDLMIRFSDENFFANKTVSRSIVEQLIPLNISWGAFTDVSIAEDEELLTLARKSGCKVLLIGFESVSKESLTNVDPNDWKLKKMEKYQEYAERIQSKGIGVIGLFLAGLDGDTSKTFDDIISFIKENKLFMSTLSNLTPFPGTRLRERLLKENRILPTEWHNYDKDGITIVPKIMSFQELADGLVKFYDEIYNWERVLINLKHFKAMNQRFEQENANFLNEMVR